MLAQDSDRTGRGRKAVEPIRRVSDGPARQRKIIHIDMDAFYASVGRLLAIDWLHFPLSFINLTVY